MISDTEYDGRLFNPIPDPIPGFEEVALEFFHRNDGHTNILRGHLHHTVEEGPRMLEIITNVFENANRVNIREVSLVFDMDAMNPLFASVDLKGMIDHLLDMTSLFYGLTTFSYVGGNYYPFASESSLASIIVGLPNLHTVVIHSGHSNWELIEYGADLGEALASLENLRSLNIRNLQTFNRHWFELRWLPDLWELTIEVDTAAPKFDAIHLPAFCYIFHESLVSLYIERNNISHPVSLGYREFYMGLGPGYTNLTFLTYSGKPAALWAFSRAPNLRVLTWSIVSRRFDDPREPEGLEEFRITYPPSAVEGRWPALRVVNLSDEVERKYRYEADDPRWGEVDPRWEEVVRFRDCLEQNGVELKYIPFDDLSRGPDLGFINRASNFHPKPFCLPIVPEFVMDLSS